jgi:acetyl-CoA carboxylase carboxyl transferase subunit beta|tara:strand:- start:4661 stop:6319 length:1659 start_codon:yes stop_codon:yes gene_type:complete
MLNNNDNSIELGKNLSKCLSCDESIDQTDFYKKYNICPFCNFHYSIDYKKRIEIISDQNTFKEINKNISIKKPYNLNLDENYKKNVRQTRNRTGLEEAAITGTCNIGGIKTVIILLDFGFMGGSMGLIVGEKISKAFNYASRNKLPVISMISSGGERVQEGLFSLVQMIKTVISTKELEDKELPHISLFSNPSGGQVYGSFANRADFKLAEPGAIIGLFPLNELMDNSKGASKIDISSENFFRKGLIDKVIPRNTLKVELFTILENIISNYKIPKKINLNMPNLDFKKSKLGKKEIESGRPTAKKYIEMVFEDFIQLGNQIGNDQAISGIAKIASQPVIIIGQNYQRNLSSDKGVVTYNDLLKIEKYIILSEKFKIPIVFFVDNKGFEISYKNEILGLGNKLSKVILDLSSHKQQIISIIIGEATSEASVPFLVSDSVMMLENAIFWPNNQNIGIEFLTSKECLDNNLIDSIIPEPPLGAGKGPEDMARLIKISLINAFSSLNSINSKNLLKNRNKKFLTIDLRDKKLISTVSEEIKLWKEVLEASYKGLKK